MKPAIAGCTALAAAVTVRRLAGTWALPPFLALLGVAVALTWIDLTQRRLPNRIVLPALGASVPVLLLVVRRMRSILFGPWMLAGLWLALAASPIKSP